MTLVKKVTMTCVQNEVQLTLQQPAGWNLTVRPKTLRSQRALDCVPCTSTPQLWVNPFHTCCMRQGHYS